MRFTALAASLLAISPLASATTDCTWRYDSHRGFNYYYLETDFGGNKAPANFCKDLWQQFDPTWPEGYCNRYVDTKCVVRNDVATVFFWIATGCQNSKIEHALSVFVPASEAVCIKE